ncbi:MAG: hypothetical protein ACOC97_00625 [Myxococcota bacterium]
MARLSLPIACAVLLLAYAATAHAHGRFPNSSELHFHPSDSDVMLLQTTRGLVVTRDGGQTWQWLCYEIVSENTFGQQDPALALLEDDSVLVASRGQGVTTLAPSWCEASTQSPSASQSYYIIDVERHPAVAGAAYALTSSGGDTVNRLFRRTDGGEEWMQTNDGIAAVFLESLGIDPSAEALDSTIMYIGGVTTDAEGERTGLIFRSDDGGATWGEPVSQLPLAEDENRPLVAGIDPTDRDRVFIHVQHNTFASDPPPDRLLLSENGGEDFEEVFTTASIGGFAISDDGGTVWVGDDADRGLWRSESAGAAESFEQIDDEIQVNCLQWHDERLWICANYYTDGYNVGTSEDGGESITPLFDPTDIDGRLSCPDGSRGATVCDAAECEALVELGVDVETSAPQCVGWGDGGPASDGGGPADAGSNGNGGGGGCGCRVAPGLAGGSPPGASALLVIAGVGFTWRRRRGRRSLRPRRLRWKPGAGPGPGPRPDRAPRSRGGSNPPGS